jgi:hypothetical protein
MFAERYTDGRKSLLSVFVPKTTNSRPFDKYFRLNSPAFRLKSSSSTGDGLLLSARPVSFSGEPICDWNPIVDSASRAPTPTNWVDRKFISFGPLPPVGSDAFVNIALKKCEQCSIRCNFASDALDREAKEIKTIDLTDLLRFFDSSQNARLCPSEVCSAICKMALANVCRQCLPIPEDCQPTCDPEWVHFGVIYQLLNRLQSLASGFHGITTSLLNCLLNQLLSPDDRERIQICQFTQNFLDLHDKDTPIVLDSIFNLTISSMCSPNFPCLVGSVLTLLPAVCRFTRPKTKWHAKVVGTFLWSVFTANSLPAYQSHLMTFMQSNLIGPREHFLMVDIMIRCWPSLSPLKQVAFLRFLGLLISSVEPKLPHARSAKLIKLIADGATSPSASVAQAALGLLIESGLDAFVSDHSRTLFPVLYPAFAEVAQSHWLGDVRESAKRALSFFSRMDPQMFREVARGEAAPDAVKPGSSAKVWTAICKQAGENDRTLNTRGKYSEILRTFAIAHVLPVTAVQPLGMVPGRRGSRDLHRVETPIEFGRRFSVGGYRRP